MMSGDTIFHIDPSLIDVDTSGGFARPNHFATGCLPRTDTCGSAFPVFEDSTAVSMIPRSEWEALALANTHDLSDLVCKIKNQKSEGTCASNATTGAYEVVLNGALSKDLWIEFSPISIYRWIAPNASSGSVISDNLEQIRDVGALPARTDRNRSILEAAGIPPCMIDAVGYSQSFPADWKEVAKLFCVTEWFDISSFDGFVSCLLAGIPVVYGRSGHSIFGTRVVRKNNIWYIKYANSWGEWGESGFGYDSESFISNAIKSYGAFAPRAGQIPDQLLKLWQSTWNLPPALAV